MLAIVQTLTYNILTHPVWVLEVIMKQIFDVTGMTCSACSAHVEKAVNKVDGVNKVAVSLLTNSMTVEYDENKVSSEVIISAVQKAGYGASVRDEQGATQSDKSATTQKPKNAVGLPRLLISIIFCVVLMYISMGHMVKLPLPPFLTGAQNAVSFALIQFLLCLPVWYVNRSYFIVGFKRLFQRAPNMDSLIAVGSFAGGLYGVIVIFIMSFALGNGDMETVAKYNHLLYFESSAMILALVDLGKYFESRSKLKTGDAIAKLKKLAPASAIVLADGQECEVDSKSIKVGDVVVVKAGMSFPADGTVVSGNCFADESSVNGESLPREKQVGDVVIGGTVSVSGYVQVTVTSVGQDSVLHKIIALVEEAGSSKAPIQRLADKISAVFVPIVMSISLVAFIVWLCMGQPVSVALDFAISVLVISCPCALGLATPVAIMVSTGKAAERGVLIKDGETLERLASIKKVVLDKTGTITLGKPYVKDYKTILPENEFIAIVAGIEKQSEHPLGKAVVDKAEQMGIPLATPTDFNTIAGQGVTATADGHLYAVGNKRLMTAQSVDETSYGAVLDEFSNAALTCLVVARDGRYIGILGVGDEIKPTSYEAIARLKALNVAPVLLTGDNALSAKAVANAVGIDEYYAEVLPADKERKVAELMTTGVTAMVGDGINDAPALVRADVGFAVTSGADIAMDSADALLMKNDLRDVPYAIELSRKTRRNIKQNLFWAFFYNTLGIPLAAGVLFVPFGLHLSPMIGAAAMSLSSLFVVTNALRLRLFKPSKRFALSSTTTDKPAKSKQRNGLQEEQQSNPALQQNKQLSTNISGDDSVVSNKSGCAVQQNKKIITPNKENAESNQSNNTEQKEEKKMKYQLKIEGMMCMRCVAHVTNALKGVEGVEAVDVNLEQGTAQVVVANATVTPASLVSAVEAQDYAVKEIQAL